MLAARITLAHFSVSAAMSSAKSVDDPVSTVPPKSASCGQLQSPTTGEYPEAKAFDVDRSAVFHRLEIKLSDHFPAQQSVVALAI